jgi:rare lipoprotein A
MLRRSRPVQLVVGALVLAIPASAVALTVGQADAQSAIQITTQPRHVAFGREVTVAGVAPSSGPGQVLQLEFARAGARAWSALGRGSTDRVGRFRFRVPLRRSGLVRVVAAIGSTTTRAATDGASAIAPSAAAPVTVKARFELRRRALSVLEGQSAHVRGSLLPALAGRRVRLIGRSGGSWRTLATARTGRRGGFDLRYRPGSTGQHWLRVRFRGDRLNAGSWAHAGRLTVFRESVASWYTDGGGTACGFHAYYGVANRTLPCGTKVTFRSGGRSVTAVVDDRGPFVGGREWDLNQNTAGALGFGGVGTVWSSI